MPRKSKTTNKQFIARSPNSKPISENDALNCHRLVEQYLATSNGCLNPKHLIARWDENVCTVMFLTYGIVF